MKKPILIDLNLSSLLVKQFRLGTSTSSWVNKFHLSTTVFEKEYFLIRIAPNFKKLFAMPSHRFRFIIKIVDRCHLAAY